MRVAVTGASGFVGGQIAAHLAGRGHTVLAYGRRQADALNRTMPGYTAWDIASGPIPGPPVDAVVHCAALVGDWGQVDRYHAVNVDGTRNVLRSFEGAERFVYVSTSSVYSDHLVKCHLGEDASTGDCRYSPYGRTKAEAEVLIRAARPTAVILRPHIVYGPGDTTLLPRVLDSRRLGWLPVPGSGTNDLSVTHIGNFASAVECALHGPPEGGTFNISDGETAPAAVLLRTILGRIGAAARIVQVPRALAWNAAAVLERGWLSRDGTRGPPLTRYVVMQLADEHTLDISRARTTLGYVPRWTYRDGPLNAHLA